MESAAHQVASASVAAVFSISMLLAAHFFTEYRSSRMPAIADHAIPAGTVLLRSRLPIESNSGSIFITLATRRYLTRLLR